MIEKAFNFFFKGNLNTKDMLRPKFVLYELILNFTDYTCSAGSFAWYRNRRPKVYFVYDKIIELIFLRAYFKYAQFY